MKKVLTSLTTFIKKHPKTDLVLLGVGLVAFLAVTLINAPRASIWFDEGFSAYLMNFDYWQIAHFTASDVHPPFYYWVLKTWVTFFGTTELALRSLSILFGAAAAITAYFLSRKLFGRAVAALSFVFIILSPMVVRYSDEARMYTLAATIVFAATYVMVKAFETKKTKYWVWYGILVSLGMWTHYFTALAWLAHWVWRAFQVHKKGEKKSEFWKKFFSKQWLITYAVAVGLFLPWLPFMAKQLGVVQGGGFWIGQVGLYTPANFLSNYFYYLEQSKTTGWLALLAFAVIIAFIVALPKALKTFKGDEKKWFGLVAALAWVPPLLLFLSSMPPLRSSFVERYLVPAFIALSIVVAFVLIRGTRGWKPFWRVAPIIAIIGMMIFGITNVYKYGNYNKNTDTHILTRQAVELARANSPKGTPIIAADVWVFYEAAPYSTKDYPIYFIEPDSYQYGSEDMLKESDLNKIKQDDLQAFENKHPFVWFLANTGSDDVAPYDDSWQFVKTLGAYDDLTGKTNYKVSEYQVSGD